MPTKDMTGLKFHWLTVTRRAESDSNGNARWHCVCTCGNKTITHGFTLRNGGAKSCGCYSRFNSENRTTHGMARTSEYMSWQDMKDRCFNPKNPRYKHYSGRGITVCERWRNSFEAFFSDMGPKPTDKHTIDRIDNNREYSPTNCRWATKQEQNHNTTRQVWVTYQGAQMSLMQAIEMSGTTIPHRTIYGRTMRGWPIETALTTPPNLAHRIGHAKNA